MSASVNFGIYLSREADTPVTFTVTVSDFSSQDLYPPYVRQRSDLIERAYSDVDAINSSWIEKESRNLCGNRDFTYGEVRFHSFYPLL